MKDDEKPLAFGVPPEQDGTPWAKIEGYIHSSEDVNGTSWVQANLHVRDGYDPVMAAYMMAVTLLETAGAPQHVIGSVVEMISALRDEPT